jgi:hypothetical protein
MEVTERLTLERVVAGDRRNGADFVDEQLLSFFAATTRLP